LSFEIVIYVFISRFIAVALKTFQEEPSSEV